VEIKSECFDPTTAANSCMCNKFDEFLKEEGIARQISALYTPQQNGIA
jgi:hypothetical protein